MTPSEFFYPNGLWAGYARFFEPSIPSRVGNVLISSIRKALDGEKDHAAYAISLLESIHVKNVSDTKGGLPHQEVKCFPTAESKVAIEMLSK